MGGGEGEEGSPTIWSQRVVPHDLFVVNTIPYVYVTFEWNASDCRVKVHNVWGNVFRMKI
jgi:hypothetical protein